MRPLRLSRSVALAAVALLAACVPHQTRRRGSDMVIVRRTFNPVEAIARTQCQQPPAGPIVSDSLAPRGRCVVAMGDSVLTQPGQPQRAEPQRVP